MVKHFVKSALDGRAELHWTSQRSFDMHCGFRSASCETMG